MESWLPWRTVIAVAGCGGEAVAVDSEAADLKQFAASENAQGTVFELRDCAECSVEACTFSS